MPTQPGAPLAAPETLPRQIFLDEARARFDAALGAEIGFVERLVWFWSNHFCVNADATVMAGAYEREAIRPHVLGRFADMLLAAEGHPAMLLYLDNAQSIGPNSVAGINRDRGLNENLAREILELHTLGVRTVYTQDDVTSFAKVLTGWTILPTVTNPDHGGEFVFHQAPARAGPADRDRQDLSRHRRRAGPRRARRSRAPSGDGAARRHQACAPFHRRRSAAGAGRASSSSASSTPTAISRRWRRRWSRRPRHGAPERAKIKRPGEWMMADLRAARSPATSARMTWA